MHRQLKKQAKKTNNARGGWHLHEDDEHLTKQAVQEVDELLQQFLEGSGIQRFWQMVQSAAKEVFNHIEKSYEQQDIEALEDYVDVLESWVSRFRAGNLITSMMFLGKALLYVEADPDEAEQMFKKAKIIVEDTDDVHFLSRILLLEGDSLMARDPKKSANCLINCITFCQQNAMFYSKQEHNQIREDIRTCLLMANYKLAQLERATDDEPQVVMRYLRSAMRQAIDIFGLDSPLTKRLEQRCVQQSYRSRAEDSPAYNSPPETARKKTLTIFNDRYEVEDGGYRKEAHMLITFDDDSKELEIQVTTDNQGLKQKSQLSFQLGTVEPEDVKKLGTNLRWLAIKNNRISIDEQMIKKLTAKRKSDARLLLKEFKKSSNRQRLSMNRSSQEEKEPEEPLTPKQN